MCMKEMLSVELNDISVLPPLFFPFFFFFFPARSVKKIIFPPKNKPGQ